MLAQRQRIAQISALRREGIYLEEEYHEEIRAYMHEMEVSAGACGLFRVSELNSTPPSG